MWSENVVIFSTIKHSILKVKAVEWNNYESWIHWNIFIDAIQKSLILTPKCEFLFFFSSLLIAFRILYFVSAADILSCFIWESLNNYVQVKGI